MSSPCRTSAVLIVFVAFAVGVGAEQSKERSCDVIGDESSESQTEKALLKKLEPLSQMRYCTTPCRPWWPCRLSTALPMCQGEGKIWGQAAEWAPLLVGAATGFQVSSVCCSESCSL